MQARAQARGSRNGRARDEHPGEPTRPDGGGPGAPALRAGGYVRVSQERNLHNRYGMDAQLAEVERYVEYRGWNLSEVYRENGVSGYVRERPALDRLLADGKEGKFDVAVFPSIDRAARSVTNMIEIDDALRESNVTVVFIREGVDTSTPMGQFFRNICASIAQFEGKLIYERVSKGKRRKAAQVVDGRVVVIEEEEEAIVQRIFEWRASGRSLRWMARKLNADGVPTQHRKKWYPSTVWDLYRNRFYTGRSKFDGAWVRGQHRAIVTDELFRRANAGNGRQHGSAPSGKCHGRRR